MKPCVEGFDPGDTIVATVMAEYPHPERYYDPRPTPPFESCSLDHDLDIGQRITFHAVKRVGGGGELCSILALAAEDLPLVEMGEADLSALTTIAGATRHLGIASHYWAVVDGCTRAWIGSLQVPDESDPLAPYSPTEPPPALLARNMGSTDSTCSYQDPLNSCLLAVELEKL